MVDEEVESSGVHNFLDKQHAACVLLRLHDLRKRKELCDVTIVVGGRTIAAHRAVLAASSLYFNAMFTGRMSERNQSKVNFETHNQVAAKLCISRFVI